MEQLFEKGAYQVRNIDTEKMEQLKLFVRIDIKKMERLATEIYVSL